MQRIRETFSGSGRSAAVLATSGRDIAMMALGTLCALAASSMLAGTLAARFVPFGPI